ncbi:MAG: bifunctional methionine sulfoxide reductase B/A protein [Thermoguttaceae bacterium]
MMSFRVILAIGFIAFVLLVCVLFQTSQKLTAQSLAQLAISNPSPDSKNKMNYNQLTPEEERIIVRKGTEKPGTGSLLNETRKGTYLCRRCDSPLYDSSDKFSSNCGWPSFDDEIDGAVLRIPDVDGVRTEIVCVACGGHLGHVFLGEKITPKETRHCVNSLSMKFVPNVKLRAAYFASGCFWGTEYFLSREDGVRLAKEITPQISKDSQNYAPTLVGYMGGTKNAPTYKEVCSGKTGHAETVRVLYDAEKTNYEKLLRVFFETHDFSQVDRQGPDIGTQYRSMIFYVGQQERQLAESYLNLLRKKGFDVATRVEKAEKFWPAEQMHRNYFENKGQTPTCHVNRRIFDDDAPLSVAPQ